MSEVPQERLDLESPPPADVPEEEQLSEDDFEGLPEDDQEALLETPPGSEDRPGLLKRIGDELLGKSTEKTKSQPPVAKPGEPEVIPPVEPGAKPDKPVEQPVPLSEEQIQSFGGRFKTVQELAKGYGELETDYSRKVNLATRVEELEAAAQQVPAPQPGVVEQPVDEDPMPKYDQFNAEESMAQIIAWQGRDNMRHTEEANRSTLEEVKKIVRAAPAVAKVDAFLADHPMVTTDMLDGIAKVGGKHGLTTFEEAFPLYLTELSAVNGQPGETGSGNTEPSTPAAGGETQPAQQTDAEKAAAIKAVAGIPPSLSEAPQTPPDKAGDLARAKAMPLSEFEKLPEKEQERLQELGVKVTDDT